MYGLIDVGDWQTYVDLKTGLELDTGQPPMLAELLKNSPYPGDGEISVSWVRQTAERIISLYDPHWLMLTYTQPVFAQNTGLQPESLQPLHRRIINDILELCRSKAYETVIVMTGAKVPLKEEIINLPTTGLLETSPWGSALAGLSGAVPEDEEILLQQPYIKQVVSKTDILTKHPEADENFRYYLPDYCLVAADGYLFRGFNSHFPKKKILADLCAASIPVYSTLGTPNHIRELYGIMKNALLNGKKVLLAVIEGYRADAAVPSGFHMCGNKDEWYSYAGLAQYLLLSSGKAFYETPYPPVYNRTKKKRETVYPFSGFFVSIPADTLGDLPGIRSAVVSSRSMIVHMAANADLAIECYCRDKSTMGTMAAIKQALASSLA
jgi:hypothetical protein